MIRGLIEWEKRGKERGQSPPEGVSKPLLQTRRRHSPFMTWAGPVQKKKEKRAQCANGGRLYPEKLFKFSRKSARNLFYIVRAQWSWFWKVEKEKREEHMRGCHRQQEIQFVGGPEQKIGFLGQGREKTGRREGGR